MEPDHNRDQSLLMARLRRSDTRASVTRPPESTGVHSGVTKAVQKPVAAFRCLTFTEQYSFTRCAVNVSLARTCGQANIESSL